MCRLVVFEAVSLRLSRQSDQLNSICSLCANISLIDIVTIYPSESQTVSYNINDSN